MIQEHRIRAHNWWMEHAAHVSKLVLDAEIAYAPEGLDTIRPELWKAEHWKWFTTQPVVHENNIIGTKLTVFSAWEPYVPARLFGGSHSSMTTLYGRRMGRIGTRTLPPELETLPAFSNERVVSVTSFHENQYNIAYAAILEAHPGLTGEISRTMGEITVRSVK